MFGIPSSPPSTYLTLSLRNLGFVLPLSSLLSLQAWLTYPQVSRHSRPIFLPSLTKCSPLSRCLSSRSFRKRSTIVPLCRWRKISGSCRFWLLYTASPRTRTSGFTLVLPRPCYPTRESSCDEHSIIRPQILLRYTHPIQVGWCSRNSGAVASRTVNASLYNMWVPFPCIPFSLS